MTAINNLTSTDELDPTDQFPLWSGVNGASRKIAYGDFLSELMKDTNPMTTLGDVIFGIAKGVQARLPIGVNGQVLGVVGGVPAWTAGGLSNPMTAAGDVIIGGSGGTPTRLPVSTNGFVLTLAAGIPTWAASGGFTSPMTTTGDMIYSTPGSTPVRLGIGSTGQVLTVTGGVPTWSANIGFTNPMTTAGDLITGGSGGAAGRLAAGTNGFVLTMVSGAPAWGAASAGGLTNWTEAVNASSPNATVPVVSLTATNAATDVDAAINPKGNGALTARPSTASLNKRGTKAVDWQMQSSSSTCVASGSFAVIGGGDNNTASNTEAVVSGGTFNTASGAQSLIAGGSNNVASNTNSVVGGGITNTASGLSSVVPGGQSNTASGSFSIAMGQWATTRGIYGMKAVSASRFAASGDAQAGTYVLRRTTTTATPDVLAADGSTAAATNTVVLPDNSTYGFSIEIVARNGVTAVANYKIEGTIKRASGAATCAIVGTPTVTNKGVEAGASSWAVSASANTTLGGLAVNVTGAASTTITWLARVETAELVA